jgi:hypothetical protein
MLTYGQLKDKPKELLAATGLKRAEFERLLPAFAAQYDALCPADQTLEGKPRRRRRGGGAKGKIPSLEDKLLFILVYQKTYPLQVMHGLQFGLSQPQTNEWIQRLLPVLQQALKDLGMTPTRDPEAVATDPLVNETAADLLIDGTERRRQRPQDAHNKASITVARRRATRIRMCCWSMPRPRKWSISAQPSAARPTIRKWSINTRLLIRRGPLWAKTPASRAMSRPASSPFSLKKAQRPGAQPG